MRHKVLTLTLSLCFSVSFLWFKLGLGLRCSKVSTIGMSSLNSGWKNSWLNLYIKDSKMCARRCGANKKKINLVNQMEVQWLVIENEFFFFFLYMFKLGVVNVSYMIKFLNL